ncbi:asparagine synthase-domain-containing protein [Catenaria anguillulae PL171]|uniref:Asparagine synthase-domain-containing protein n=1 Tax=Catenaria anguillulae PL171 TaxID=765915 RepID=A0A1Y2HC79_9FUNG|nr:asparagine synthase-domain-containing protein [Catenaria anguillulae PL171]
MCGISVTILNDQPPVFPPPVSADTMTGPAFESDGPIVPHLLPRRGPDHMALHSMPIKGCASRTIHLAASVLHLRGSSICRQPVLLAGTTSALCWNGQVYHGLGVNGDLQHLNDTALVAGRLEQLEAEITASKHAFALALRDMFEEIEAEFAFAFYHSGFRTLYFGRDVFGRRSLLIRSSESSFSLASVDLTGNCQELDADGLYYVDAATASFAAPDSLTRIPWRTSLTTVNLAPTPSLPPPADPALFPPLTSIPSDQQQAIETLYGHLSESVRVRVLAHPPDSPNTDPPAPIAILFSGGLDCSILAALAHTHLPPEVPIDLINVAFANPRALSAKQSKSHQVVDPYLVPDRITARARLSELEAVYPMRHWRLLECNVPYARVEAERAHILRVMKPTNTVMDLSIALALWFAARQEGLDPATPRAKIVLSGLGADEQCGGYSRHRGAFDNVLKADPANVEGAWAALARELQVDVARIATRNLGRDDRIISDHGREVRLPFLDARVVGYLSTLPVHFKCDPRYAKGVGDKVILRVLAKYKLGLHSAAEEEKRAIQFGARSAKLEVGTGKDTGGMVVGRASIE